MLKPTSELLNAGDTAPEFELPTVERHTIRLADYRGKPLAVIFIRGTW
jgi:peroxiredoxin